MRRGMGEMLRRFNHNTKVMTEVDITRVLQILKQHPWSPEMIEEAARGSINADCNDPPEVMFAFQLALSEHQADRWGITREEARNSVIDQAKRGLFNANE